MKPVLLHLSPERRTVDPQFRGRLPARSPVLSQGFLDHVGFGSLERFCVLDSPAVGPLDSRVSQFLRQAGEVDPISTTKNEGMFDDVFKLPDISGILVPQEDTKGLLGETADLAPHLGIKFLDEGIDEEGDVFFPLGERGELDLNNVEPVEEILPKLPSADELGEVLVRRRNDPGVGLS